MRKVLKFVKGRREDKKDHGSSSLGPFAMEISAPSAGTPGDDDHYMPFNHGYIVDTSGKDKTFTKLHKAAWAGNLDKLKVNLKKIDIDSVDKSNRTPLHLASARGHTNLVWFLLNNKAKMTICDNEGRTPFLKAIECGHKDLIQLMLEKGVDLTTVDYSGNSGLHISAQQGLYEIASILLKEGAHFETSNIQGEFPLHIATWGEHKDLVELLIRYGSSVNVVDRDHRSPLMFAAKNGNMPLVQLFLDNGAQRRVMDSHDWTAEDYALQGKHLDVAAELKSSPSDRVQSLDEDLESIVITSEVVSLSRRSFSPAATMSTDKKKEEPDKREVPDKSKDDLSDKKSEDLLVKKKEDPDSDTWDSQSSEASSKPVIPGLRLMKFVPPSSDDEISEESVQSPIADAKDSEGNQDSPRSCVIPPPCKPPRSWDLIQAGMIDDINTSSEPRRRSLLTLGSLRSKRESFTESPNAESPSSQVGQGDGPWLTSHSFNKQDSLLQHCSSFDSRSNKSSSPSKSKVPSIEIEGKELKLQDDCEKVVNVYPSRGSLDVSDSESDWDSDASLPMDTLPVTTSVISTEGNDRLSPIIILETVSDDLEETTNNVPVAVSDKKSRVLLRVPPIDLTDEDVELGREMEREKDRSDSSDGDRRFNLSSSGGETLGRDGTLQGYDEVWETNVHVSEDNLVLSRPSSSSPLASDNTAREKSNEKLTVEDELLFPSPQLCERSIEEDSLDSVKQLSISGSKMKMSTSLDFKKQTLATYLEGNKNNNQKYESHSLDNLDDVDGKPKVPKRHLRQMSVACQPWKSEDLWQKPTLPPPPPISLDRMLADNKRINAQLECYDEALRELAQVKIIKKPTNSNEPKSTRYSGTKNHRYLSLPRTNELIDEAFKEMGQSSVSTIQRGSLSLPRTATAKDMISEPVQDLESAERGSSLPRTITPKDMILESDPVPPPRRRKSLQTRNRTDSEGEKSGKELRNRPLSLDIKYHLHNIDNQIVRLPKSQTMGFDSLAGDENISPNITSIRRTSIEKPIRKKRKTLLAMRGLNHESLNNSQSSVASVEESFDEQPFAMSSDGLLPRQCTVIERRGFVPVHASSPQGGEMGSLDLREENERLSLEYDAELDLPPPPPEAFCSPVADGKLGQSESLDNPRYSPSDESGMSQNDVTPQHSYSIKSHHSLLKQHLRETTAEKSRLEETAADLGEKTEKLKYELADAREASRSRDEVIALLQGQLKRMEEMYTECLEEIQGYRLRLGNQEQELRHLKDVCNKFDEEKESLNEIIRANEEEKAELDKALAVNGEERVLEITIKLREKEKEHQEMKIHLLHLEEEKQKSLEEIECLEKKNLELEEKLDRSVSKIRILGEEKAGLTVQSSGSQEESRKWQELYESCLMRLEQLATNCSVEVRDVKTSAEDFRDELRGINEKLLQMRDQYDLVRQEKTYEQFVASDKQQIEELVEKLETDLKESEAKQCNLEIELQETKSELTEVRKLMHEKESSTLFEELKKVNVELRQQSEQTRSQIDFRDEDLKVKLNSLNDLNQSVTSLQGTLNFLEDLHRSKDEIQARFDLLVKEKSDTDQQLSHLQAWVVEIQRLKECEAKARETVSIQTDADETENNLRSELKDLRHRCDELEGRETKTAQTQTTCEIVARTQFDTLSQDHANQEAELERSLVVLKDARTAMNTTELDNRALRDKLEEMKAKVEKYQQEIEEYRKRPQCTCDDKKVARNIPNINVTVRVLKENEPEEEKPSEVSSDVKCQDVEEIGNLNLESKENIECKSKDTLPSNETIYSRVVTGISGGSLNSKEAIQEEIKEMSSQQELCSNSKKKMEDVLTKDVNNFPVTVDNVDDNFNKTRTLFTRSVGIGTTDSCSSMGLINADQSSVLFQVHNLEKKSTVAGIELEDSMAGVDLKKKSTKEVYEEPEAEGNASLRSKLQVDKERLKENEKLIKNLKDEIVWLKTCSSEEKQSDGSIGHKTSCSNDEEFRKKVNDLEQKVREENNKRFALEVQVNKMKYDLQEKLKLENELVVLRNRLERDFVSRYELDHLRKSYEAALNRPKNAAAAPRPPPSDEDDEDHVVRNKLRDSLANQSAGEQRLQEARLKLRSEVASAEVTCSFVKDKRDELAKQSQASLEKKDRERQRQIIERAYNKHKATPVINLDKPLPVHRKCSASCSLCNSQHPMPCPGPTTLSPGHTAHLKPTLSPGKNILSALAPSRCVHAQGLSDQFKSTLNLRQSKSQLTANNTTYTDSYQAITRNELDKSIRKHSQDPTPAVAPPASSKALEDEENSKHHEKK